MPSCQSIPGDERPTFSSTAGTELGAERYINSVIDMFPSAFPPIDDCNYDSHAPRTTLINPYPPSAAEISRATRAFAAGNLHVLAMSDNSVDMIHLRPGDTTQFPLVDVWLQSVFDNDDVSHSGPMMGVTGSLFIPHTDALPKSDIRAELKIRLASGPAVNFDFETIYVDPVFDTMHGWAEGGNERGPMPYWAGKVVLPPDITGTELSTLAPPIEPSGLKEACESPVRSRETAIPGM
jgi:hypothetical protein